MLTSFGQAAGMTRPEIPPNAARSGFTLIEMLITLMVIALLAGGVLVGKHMVAQAEINRAVSDIQRFAAAINTFKMKYGALPGDISNPQKFWPTAYPGNNNGRIDRTSSGALADEGRFVWQHLALATLVDGKFTGTTSNGNRFERGGNLPPGPRGLAYHIGSDLNLPSSASPGTYFYLAGVYPDDNYYGDAFTPTELYTLDMKFDNGNSGTGVILGRTIRWPADRYCPLGGGGYKTNNPNHDCVLVFRYD